MPGRARTRSRSPSRTPSPRRSRSRSRSRSPSRSRSRSPSPSRSRTPSPSRSRSRSPDASLGNAGWDAAEVCYDDFVAADEEVPTFKLEAATVDLIRKKVYQAAPLGMKHFNDLKKEKYMLAREVHETLEPKPVPAEAVSSAGGMDFNRLHGSLHTLHNTTRLSQRPIWALVEELQRTRGNLKKIPSTAQFESPPSLLQGPSIPPGHVTLDYLEEEELRHMAKPPQDLMDSHKKLGVYMKFHDVAVRSMNDMIDVIQSQQEALGKVKGSLNEMWSRSQDFLNMARYLETQIKEMRRTQLVKAHTKDFVQWLENIHFKDRARLGARDESDEILAANYQEVLKQYNEDRKNRNTALKKSSYTKRTAGSGLDPGPSSSGRQSGRDNRRQESAPPRRGNPPAAPKQQPKRNSGGGARKRGPQDKGSSDSDHKKKKTDKDKAP